MNEDLRKQLISYAIHYDGEYGKIKKAIEQNEKWEEKTIDCNVITILDDDYPKKLLRLAYPPFVLFYIGDLTLLKLDSMAIVGSRKICEYGETNTCLLSQVLSERYVIVSGMAKGVDRIAHLSAKKTIAVLGCGFDYCYPKENLDLFEELKEKQLLISEYPPHAKPLAFHFPWRNRIIAALSEGIVVTQACVNSGTMHTVNEALELNLPIYCIPYPINQLEGYGCNLLILQGANIITSIEDMKKL